MAVAGPNISDGQLAQLSEQGKVGRQAGLVQGQARLLQAGGGCSRVSTHTSSKRQQAAAEVRGAPQPPPTHQAGQALQRPECSMPIAIHMPVRHSQELQAAQEAQSQRHGGRGSLPGARGIAALGQDHAAQAREPRNRSGQGNRSLVAITESAQSQAGQALQVG